jgi:hypothetical protein
MGKRFWKKPKLVVLYRCAPDETLRVVGECKTNRAGVPQGAVALKNSDCNQRICDNPCDRWGTS